jgi:predicted esterase
MFTWIRTEFPFSYEVREVSAPREMILLLHGFSENGARILRKLSPYLPSDAYLLSPNGPFPVRRRSPEHPTHLGYSWYIYDPARDEYDIDMRVAIDYLNKGMESLGLANLPKRVIGFSQGGYLGPVAAPRLVGVRQVIGLGCEVLIDELASDYQIRTDSVHGVKDEVVSIESARKTHGAFLEKKGTGLGTFVELTETGHRIDRAAGEAVKSLLARF